MRHLQFYVLVLVALLFAVVASERVDSAKSKAASERDRLMQQARRRAPRPEYDIHFRPPLEFEASGNRTQSPRHSQSSVMEWAGDTRATSVTPPPPSPGLAIGMTSWDVQHEQSQGYQVARLPGADIVHFGYTVSDRLPTPYAEPEYFFMYNAYQVSTSTLLMGFGGCDPGQVPPLAGYASVAAGVGNKACVALHQREYGPLPYKPWVKRFPIEGNCLRIDEVLGGYASGGCPEVSWPRVDASQAGSHSIHLIAHSNIHDCQTNLVWYWRYNDTSWTGPVIIDSTPTLGYVLTDDPTSDKLAIVTHADNHASMNDLNNIVYHVSTTDGVGWIAGTESIVQNVVTSYSDPSGSQAWLHISTAYDNAGVLHIVWDEQRFANLAGDVAIRHWNSARQTIRPVALGYWPAEFASGRFSLNLSKVTLGIGDGGTTCGGQANDDYLYVLCTRFGGPTAVEQADHSALGYYNGELYLNVSKDGGLSWSPSRNLTNSKTPNCYPGIADTASGIPQFPDSVCRSEHWATIGKAVSDIDIFFVSDLDAGGAAYGEGNWQYDRVNYLRLPGGTPDAEYLCPEISPNMAVFASSTAECEYHAAPGEIKTDETLTIMNIGNATLSGSVSVIDAPWLTVAGGGGFAMPPGSNDLVLPLTMNATSLVEGLYSGTIRITHNDSAQPSPYDIPIDFFVIGDFNCTQGAVISTGVE